MHLISALLFVAVGIMTATNVAGMPANERLFVGKTNIFCVQAPCPWRGILSAEVDSNGPANLLWTDQSLPPLDASEEDAEKIVAAWNGDRCVAVHGRLRDGRLYVDAIAGECR